MVTRGKVCPCKRIHVCVKVDGHHYLGAAQRPPDIILFTEMPTPITWPPNLQVWPPIIPGCTSPRAPNTSHCSDSHWAAHTSAAIVDETLVPTLFKLLI